MLEIKITKTLPDFKLDVDLTLDREILSVLGPSGSGKTMTLQCVAGLIQPDQGLIRLNGRTLYSSAEKISLPPQQRGVGFVFQNYALFPHLTVAENIAYSLVNQPAAIRKKRVDELLELIHIPGLRNQLPRQLSSGQQQRVALARALAPEPEALLLDEPFSALDTFRRERLEYELLSLHEIFKNDLLFVTHDLEQGFKLGKRMAIFDQGSIVQCDQREQVIITPVNKTAARLTGVKNIFAVKIVIRETGRVKVYCPEFKTTFEVQLADSVSLQSDLPYYLGIRPEHLSIVDKQGGNTVNCRIDQTVSGITNVSSYYYARNDHNQRYRIEMKMPGGFKPRLDQSGASCYLLFPPEKTLLITG